MDRSKHPLEKLRTERELRGWSQRKVATEIGTSEKRVSAWELGESAPGPHFREKLCLLFGKNTLELGLQGKRAPASPSPHEGDNGYFSFGKRETQLLVLDGEGTEAYLPQHIKTFYYPHPIPILEEIEQAKKQIAEEQEQNEKEGRSVHWNGETYHLTNFVMSREPLHERMKLNIWFHPTDYYTVLAKNRCLEDRRFREKYLLEHDWEMPLPSLPIPFGVGLSLVSSDGYIFFAQRGRHIAVRPGYFMTSVEEGLSRPLDRSTTSEAPDVYRCACRGLFEELGLQEHLDFSASDILFLSLGLDTQYAMCGLRGFIKVQKSADEIKRKWQRGVKDKLENKHLFAVRFTPQDVFDFVFLHEPWGAGALMGIYHTLIHEFGREEVERVIALKS